MTTPTREQVVQWFKQAGLHDVNIDRCAYAVLQARSDLEETITKQAAEIDQLREDAKDFCGQVNRLVEHNNNLCSHRDELKADIADLEATIAEQAAEIERLKAAADPDTEALHIAYLHGQGDARILKALIKDQQAEITEQQAHIERLREAFNESLGCWERDCVPDDYFRERAEYRELLSIPSSADALREHDAKLVERIAKFCDEIGDEDNGWGIADKIRKGEF